MTEPMFLRLDEWHDYLRFILLLACCVSFVMLVHKYLGHRKYWNMKTKDYWYALLMWSIAGISYGTEGIVRDRPLGPTLVFVFAAAVVSVKGVLKKGAWGEHTA